VGDDPGSSRGGDGGVEPLSRDFVRGHYPIELEDDITVRTGSKLRLRPIRPDDAEKLVAFHSRLSWDSIYRRYFSMHPQLSAAEVSHFTRVDYVDRLALVIEDDGQLVGVGRYDRYPLTSKAEVAFVVADDHQHLGLGVHLLEHLAEAAWARGITTFTAETQAINRDMLAVFRHSGFPVESSFEDGEISVQFCIEPTDASRTRREDYRLGRT
jgi:GNAT superfamily N-acetyltransferase